MRYRESVAYSMSAPERGRESFEEQSRSFEVVSGGGLDARAREGVSPLFVARLRAVLVVAAVLIAIGMARVGISAATVSLLRSNVTLGSQIEEAESLNEQLRVQRSALSSNARISRIATQNYGMVAPAESVSLVLSGAEDEAAQAETTDEAQSPSDGDAAQSADAAAEQPDLS